MSFYIDPFHRLFLLVIQRHAVISRLFEIDGFQVDATDIAVVHGAIINHPVLRIRGHRELRGARYVGGGFSPRLFATCRDVEVIQDVKCLKNAVLCRGLLRSCQLKESRSYKPGRRGEIPRKSEQTGSVPEGLHLQRTVIVFRGCPGL